ncbi:hypothetical protein PAHAL_5G325400 [Panicum hallii]|uniref:Uncharacterized protein n=1 Tax=Panicum hallii TaxID=206008 RepID=A0A2T8ILX5_9POAL|nr:hypothetical protein PAHAL_5G325400 [Panicum hallii]
MLKKDGRGHLIRLTSARVAWIELCSSKSSSTSPPSFSVMRSFMPAQRRYSSGTKGSSGTRWYTCCGRRPS